MKCLRCESVALEVQTRGQDDDQFEIDVCPKCAGTWLDQSELEKIDESLFVDLEKIDYTEVEPTVDDAALICQRCEGSPKLTKGYPARYPDVVVDICPECKGFWLDSGEIHKMREVSDRLLLKSLD